LYLYIIFYDPLEDKNQLDPQFAIATYLYFNYKNGAFTYR